MYKILIISAYGEGTTHSVVEFSCREAADAATERVRNTCTGLIIVTVLMLY